MVDQICATGVWCKQCNFYTRIGSLSTLHTRTPRLTSPDARSMTLSAGLISKYDMRCCGLILKYDVEMLGVISKYDVEML